MNGAGTSKRERTRATLLQGAIEVFAARGISAARITDVTDHVGMSNGTFYNYFDDKDALVQAVGTELGGGFARAVDEAMRAESDGVRRVVRATTTTLDAAVGSGGAGVVLMELVEHSAEVRTGVLAFLRADLELGVSQGRFDVEVDEFLLEQIVALILAGVRTQQRQGADASLTRRTTEHVLRLCGLTPSAARRAAGSAS